MATSETDNKTSGWKETIGLGMKFVISSMISRFPTVKQAETYELDKWLNSDDREVVLLDCRDPREYEVSHVPQAVRVEWKTEDVDKVLNSFSHPDNDESVKKTVVCYCSLGYRSCSLAKRIQETMETKENPPKVEVYNLAGSLFKWANEGRPLVDSEGQKTKFAHPYTLMWSVLLNKELRKW